MHCGLVGAPNRSLPTAFAPEYPAYEHRRRLLAPPRVSASCAAGWRASSGGTACLHDVRSSFRSCSTPFVSTPSPVTKVVATPLRPARPVRPIRCVYASMSLGMS